jgi:hypothetical protein
MRQLEEDRMAIEHEHDLCVARLEAAQAADSLNFLEGYVTRLEQQRLFMAQIAADIDNQVVCPIHGYVGRGRPT